MILVDSSVEQPANPNHLEQSPSEMPKYPFHHSSFRSNSNASRRFSSLLSLHEINSVRCSLVAARWRPFSNRNSVSRYIDERNRGTSYRGQPVETRTRSGSARTKVCYVYTWHEGRKRERERERAHVTRVRTQALTPCEHVYAGIYTALSRGRGNERVFATVLARAPRRASTRAKADADTNIHEHTDTRAYTSRGRLPFYRHTG